jgi:hypothetical protein
MFFFIHVCGKCTNFADFPVFPARDRKNQTKIALNQREPVAFGTIQYLDHRRSIGVNVTLILAGIWRGPSCSLLVHKQQRILQKCSANVVIYSQKYINLFCSIYYTYIT